jgi:hypothetical protein
MPLSVPLLAATTSISHSTTKEIISVFTSQEENQPNIMKNKPSCWKWTTMQQSSKIKLNPSIYIYIYLQPNTHTQI